MKIARAAKFGLNVCIDTMSDFERTMVGVFDMMFFVVQCTIFIAVAALFTVGWILPVLFYEYVLIQCLRKVVKFVSRCGT